MISLPWYIGGPLIGLMVPLLLILIDKQLGVSSAFRFAGSYVLPKVPYFKYNRKADQWQAQFAFGIVLTALILSNFGFRTSPEIDSTKSYGLLAKQIYSLNNWWVFLLGGIALGFGSRYANGCTAGHCIMGNALFTVNSFVTTLAFFCGGLFVTFFVIPFIL